MTARVAVITGGGSGLGLAIAEHLVGEGWQVVLSGRNVAALEAACKALYPAASMCICDVSSRADVERMRDEVIARHPVIDALVNNAGVMESGALDWPMDALEPVWDRSFAINVKGTMMVTHAFAQHLRVPGGRVVNLSSIVARTGASVTGLLAYAASKASVEGLTYALARELSPKGITVNAVAPGMIEGTAMTGTFDDERKAKIKQTVPIGRGGRPSEIAGTVAWLLSDGGGYVSGAVIPVNGGWRFG